MSKLITSPVNRWQGQVTISDPLTLPQVELIEAGMELPADTLTRGDGQVYFTVLDKPQIPAILACVEKWELQDFPYKGSAGLKAEITIETFPMSPRRATHELIAWLFGEIRKVYLGELEVPNE